MCEDSNPRSAYSDPCTLGSLYAGIPVSWDTHMGNQTLDQLVWRLVCSDARTRIRKLNHRVRCQIRLDAQVGVQTLHLLEYVGWTPEVAHTQKYY